MEAAAAFLPVQYNAGLWKVFRVRKPVILANCGVLPSVQSDAGLPFCSLCHFSAFVGYGTV